MLKVNGQKVEIGNFPDGTMLINGIFANGYCSESLNEISWYYENDSELLALIFITKHLRANGNPNIVLFMPYIPNARQDRVKSNKDVFTLKYFAEVINDLKFDEVFVLDPHSYVSEALINNIRVISPEYLVKMVLQEIGRAEYVEPLMFYPDEGASKRYSGMIKLPYAFGIKKRDWQTGKILSLDVAGDIDKIKGNNILIVDDICSKGGTFYYAAKKLKELGAKNIYLYISHCENSILTGDLIKSDLVKQIFTTNSIFTQEHPLIKVFDLEEQQDD